MQDSATLINEHSSLQRTPDQAQPVTNVELMAELGDIGPLRGVTETAADLAPCTCPEPCERDHANE
jgi:hypothetical protein